MKYTDKEDNVDDPDEMIKKLELPTLYSHGDGLSTLVSSFKKSVWDMCNYSDDKKRDDGLQRIQDIVEFFVDSIKKFKEGVAHNG